MSSKRSFFIDLFCGCGGISLGLINAGWIGLFAIDRSELAFETFSSNLLETHSDSFRWPKWLSRKSHDVQVFARKYENELKGLQGKVDLIAGGPPCQGFSFAGSRTGRDQRNELFKTYLAVVGLVRPRMIVLENVEGITVPFGKEKAGARFKGISYSEKIENGLEKLGYKVFKDIVSFDDYGVPQCRKRFIMMGFLVASFEFPIEDPFIRLGRARCSFLRSKSLPVRKNVCIRDAISDLEAGRFGTVPCPDSNGFKSGVKGGIESSYQRLMRKGMRLEKVCDSHRLVNHSQEVVDRFKIILEKCRRGVQMTPEEKKKYSTKKHSLVPTDPKKPSPTLTTLPDDILHYSEPRVFSVREYARIQSFPDWFQFKGKYTTGGKQRSNDCPRYSQVANAVPPLFAELLGMVLLSYLQDGKAAQAACSSSEIKEHCKSDVPNCAENLKRGFVVYKPRMK